MKRLLFIYLVTSFPANTVAPRPRIKSCAKVEIGDSSYKYFTTELFPNSTISRHDFQSIELDQFEQTSFWVGINYPNNSKCVLEACGLNGPYPVYCMNYTNSVPQPIDASESPYRMTALKDIHCNCKENVPKDCDEFDCLDVENSTKWTDLECAYLYQEQDCQACYFDPVVLYNGSNFTTQHSYNIKSVLVRNECNMTRYNTTDDGSSWGAKDIDGFTCACPDFKPNITTTTSPRTTTSSTTDSSTPAPSTTQSTRTTNTSPPSTTTSNTPTTPTNTPNRLAKSKLLFYVLLIAVAICILVIAPFAYKHISKRKNEYSSDENEPLTANTDEAQSPVINQTANYERLEDQHSSFSTLREELKEVHRKIQLLTTSLKIEDEDLDVDTESFESIQTFLLKICAEDYVQKRILFRFSEDDVLGEGAFGKVYKGVLETINGLETVVAIKQIKWDKDQTSMLKDSFFREVKTFKKLGSACENIVGFYGACCDQGMLYLFTEYCDGGSLETYLESELRPVYSPGLSESVASGPSFQNYVVTSVVHYTGPSCLSHAHLQQVVKWCAQIANGMAFLTQLGILQLDLAVRNVLLTRNYIVKICDFGLSRKIGNKEYFAKALIEGGFPLNSLAPEWNSVIESGTPKPLTRFVDVWSYGCTLWQLFTLNDPLYSERDNPVSPEQIFLKAHNFLKEKKRLNRPKFATDFVWDKTMQCWNEVPENRPEFLQLQEEFTEYLRTILG